MEKQGLTADHVQLAFYGSSGQEAEAFVQAVQRRAHAAGKLRDNDWIVDLVSVCFEGDALRWFESLDDKTQSDWKTLKAAILRQYPPSSGVGPSSSSPNSAGPAPPTYEAALVDTAAEVPLQRQSQTERSMSRPLPPPPRPKFRTGRIQVFSTSTSLNGYVSCELPMYGCFGLTKHQNRGLRVMYDENQATGLFDLTLLDCNANFEFLGVSWIQSRPTLARGSTDYAYVSAVGGDQRNLASSCKWPGPRQSRVWALAPDQTLSASWWGWDGLMFPLQVVVKSKNVILAADAAAVWASDKPEIPVPTTRLVFEPELD